MARFLADENFSHAVVQALRALGHDVLTLQAVGRAGKSFPDPEVLKFAAEDQRAVLTFNRSDFFRLHRESAEHAGIVACTEDADFRGLARRIHESLEAAETLRGKLLRINRPSK